MEKVAPYVLRFILFMFFLGALMILSEGLKKPVSRAHFEPGVQPTEPSCPVIKAIPKASESPARKTY